MKVDEKPVPVPVPTKPPPSAMWLILKELQVGTSAVVNRSASYIRSLIGELPDREEEPEAKRELRSRRYKVKQVDEDNARVWRLK